MLQFKRIVNKVFQSNTYILHNKVSNWLVDCGDVSTILKLLSGNQCIENVFLTHTHFDHVYGLNILLKYFPDILIYTNAFGKEALQNPKWNLSRYYSEIGDFVFSKPENIRVVDEGDKICLYDGVFMEIFSAPGHDQSCLIYKLNNNLFTGDSYIPDLKVVATFPKSNKQDAYDSVQKIINLSKGCNIYPGHMDPSLQE